MKRSSKNWWLPRRGGYCFEQNGLFERALKEVGFEVRSLLGRVVISNPPQMPPRTHRILLVQLAGEPWIADVGFGGQTLTAPIRLHADIEQITPHGVYRLQRAGDDWVLQFRHHERWQSMYQFEMGQQYRGGFCDGEFSLRPLAGVAFSPPFADVPPFAGRGKTDAHQLPFYPLATGPVQEEKVLSNVAALYETCKPVLVWVWTMRSTVLACKSWRR